MGKLNIEEEEILEAFEKGKLKAAKEIERHKAIAEATFKKDASINIRLSSKDLRALQVCGLKERVPYQTLVSSILHKYVDGQLQRFHIMLITPATGVFNIYLLEVRLCLTIRQGLTSR